MKTVTSKDSTTIAFDQMGKQTTTIEMDNFLTDREERNADVRIVSKCCLQHLKPCDQEAIIIRN